MWVTDGPTNDGIVRFYDSDDRLIMELTAPPSEIFWFAGISSPDRPIARIVIATGDPDNSPDDYYIDNLYYGTPNPLLLGDVNQDRCLDLLDINPFVNVLASGVYQLEADMDQNGSVNLLDVAPFVDLFTPQSCDNN